MSGDAWVIVEELGDGVVVLFMNSRPYQALGLASMRFPSVSKIRTCQISIDGMAQHRSTPNPRRDERHLHLCVLVRSAQAFVRPTSPRLGHGGTDSQEQPTSLLHQPSHSSTPISHHQPSAAAASETRNPDANSLSSPDLDTMQLVHQDSGLEYLGLRCGPFPWQLPALTRVPSILLQPV